MFRLFLAIFRPNKEPEFRYIYLNSGSLLGLKMAKK